MRNSILGIVAVVIIATAAFLFFKGTIVAPTVSPVPETSTLPGVTPEPQQPTTPIDAPSNDGLLKTEVTVGADLKQDSTTEPTGVAGTTIALSMNMDSGNFYFRPDTITATLNQPITIKFNNSGFHTFTINDLGVSQVLSGSTGSVTFTPTKKGTFEFYCTVGNHRDLGQKGTIIVQ